MGKLEEETVDNPELLTTFCGIAVLDVIPEDNAKSKYCCLTSRFATPPSAPATSRVPPADGPTVKVVHVLATKVKNTQLLSLLHLVTQSLSVHIGKAGNVVQS